MVKTLKQLVESIQEKLSSYKVTDDFPIDPLIIEDKIVDVNGSLIREEFVNTGKVNEQFYQRFDCNEVECMETSCVINGITVTKPRDIWRVVMPALQTGISDKDIRYFGLNSFRRNFRRVDIVGLSANKYRLYTANQPAYCLNGNEIFVVDLPTSSTKRLGSMVVLADPRTAPRWNYETSIFPTPSPYKLEMLVFKDLVAPLTLPPDLRDDAQRAVEMPSRKIAVDNEQGQ